MDRKIRVYVAGKLNDMACGYIQNTHKMIKVAEEVHKAGFAVYIPCIDFLTGVVIGNFTYKDYFDNSQPWLDVSDAIFLVPGWETSKGTKKEISRAKAQGIPVFTNLEQMKGYFRINEKIKT